MRKTLIILCCMIILQLIFIYNLKAQTNLIQNGGFENVNSACNSIVTNYMPYFNNSNISANIAPFNPLCVPNWKSSSGSADIGLLSCLPFNSNCGTCRETMLYLPECRGNFAGMGGAPQYGIAEGIFAENLNLSPDSIYTLSFLIASPHYPSYSAFVKLANGLVNNDAGLYDNSIPIVNNQTIFSAAFVKDLNKWEQVTFDFVPNTQYSQLWIYITSGWINVDDIVLKSKARYTGPVINNLTCCGTDITYANTTISTTSDKQSITVKQNATLPNNQNVSLTSGSYIQFTPDITLTATGSTTLTASIVACKLKPSINNFGGAGSTSSVYCNVNNPIGVPDKIEQGVTYNWTASPTSALNYIQNTASPYTILYPLQSINATYTLTASNNCGSISSSIAVTTTCSLRMASSEELTTKNDTQISLSYYPNPTNGKFILKVPEDLLNIDFQINDINGKNIMKGSTLQLENNIDLTGQPSGVYYITLLNKGEVIREKLIIL